MTWRRKLVAWVSKNKSSPRHGEAFTVAFSVTGAMFAVLFYKLGWTLCLALHWTETAGGGMLDELFFALAAGVCEGWVEVADRRRKREQADSAEDATMI